MNIQKFEIANRLNHEITQIENILHDKAWGYNGISIKTPTMYWISTDVQTELHCILTKRLEKLQREFAEL